MMSNNN